MGLKGFEDPNFKTKKKESNQSKYLLWWLLLTSTASIFLFKISILRKYCNVFPFLYFMNCHPCPKNGEDAEKFPRVFNFYFEFTGSKVSKDTFFKEFLTINLNFEYLLFLGLFRLFWLLLYLILAISLSILATIDYFCANFGLFQLTKSTLLLWNNFLYPVNNILE